MGCRRRTRDPSIAFGTDVRRKKTRKNGESIIKLAFYSAGERIELARARAHIRGRARKERQAAGAKGWVGTETAEEEEEKEEEEYKVTSHVYFIPVDPIKVPIIISDVFRCNMFDLVLDIL